MYPVMASLTSAEILLFFGVASGVLSTIAFVPYIRDTIARRTEPQRASWLIWSVLGSIAFLSQVFEGATSSLWFAGVQVSGTIIVFVLSIRVGRGRFLSKSDHLILVAASIGLLLWYLTDNAAYALAITVSISLLGGLATVVKAYRDPESETLVTWVVSFVASVCAIISVGVVDYTLLAYPLYLFTLYLAFIVAIVLGRARVRSVNRTVSPAMRSLSCAAVFSGLRTTADAVIVCVAFVFAFNWVGANSSAVDAVSTGNSVGNAVMPLAKQQSVLTSPMKAGVEPVEVLSLATTTSPELSGSERSEVSLSETIGFENTSIQQLVKAGFINDSMDMTRDFLLLDADDPFAKLVVTTDTAVLVQERESTVPQNPMQRGERILALATNGEWFRVQVSGGLQGYVHRSQVSVEALSSLSAKKAS